MNTKHKTIIMGATFVAIVSSGYVWLSSTTTTTENTEIAKMVPDEPEAVKAEKSPTTSTITSAQNTPKALDNTLNTLSAFDDLFPENDPAWTWSKVDLDALKQETPDNLYWILGAPTKDEALLAQRKETKAFWDKEYGKVLSSTATEAEIRAYFANQNAVSNDYVEFSTLLINRYGKELSEQAYGLQTLARNLHLARLEAIPRKLEEALKRREDHLQRREAWLANKQSFEANLEAERVEAQRALGKI